jgi:hypothetical protein
VLFQLVPEPKTVKNRMHPRHTVGEHAEGIGLLRAAIAYLDDHGTDGNGSTPASASASAWPCPVPPKRP